MKPITANRISHEAGCLKLFHEAAAELIEKNAVQGWGYASRFDPGFGLSEPQQFQFGDLRVPLDNRTVIVEVESGGGVTNLLKYWPMAETSQVSQPILLLHAFKLQSSNDYLSHRKLWEHSWKKMNTELWARDEPKLFAKQYSFATSDSIGLQAVLNDFRRCLVEPLEDVRRGIFGFYGTAHSI